MDDTTQRWKEALQARLDDELTPGQRAALEAELSTHPERAAAARDLETLARMARNARVAAPADFAERVMSGLADVSPDSSTKPTPVARRYVPAPEPGFLARLFGAGGFRPGLAGALTLAAMAVALTILIARFQMHPAPGEAPRPVVQEIAPVDPSSGGEPLAGNTTDVVVHRFVLEAPTAQKVCLVGDFNEWKLCEVPMKRDAATGQWVATVVLPKGRHQYMFVVDDGDWRSDPQADVRVDDGFGHQNAVVFL